MKSIKSSEKPSRTHSGVFDFYLKQLDTAVASLHQQRTKSISKRLEIWKGTWENAYGRRFDVQRSNVLQFGLLLGRLAESYSFHDAAEEVLDRLAEGALRRESWIPNPPSVLITAGEFNRRRGDLDGAENRYREAIQILEQNLNTAESRQQVHRELGRVFYELAYLNRLQGDAGATCAALERSEAECVLAEDGLGAEIARTLLAVVSYEEGFAEAAVARLKECLPRFERIVVDPALEAEGRTRLARRWVVNARIDISPAKWTRG